MTTTTPRPTTQTVDAAYAAAQLDASTLLAEVGRILEEHGRMPGRTTWGHVAYVKEITQGLQRIVDDYNEV